MVVSKSKTGNGEVKLITCSMLKDLDNFSVLSSTMDECIKGDFKHLVIVPKCDTKYFQKFANQNRDIVAQEELLPRNLLMLTDFGKILPKVSKRFRRPIYLDRNFKMLRGWIIQQLLKLEATRLSDTQAVMHIDSDVLFFRDMQNKDMFIEGKPIIFHVDRHSTDQTNPIWTASAEKILNQKSDEDSEGNYVENCIVWDTQIVRDMIDHIEAVHGAGLFEVLSKQKSISEYQTYGIFSGPYVANGQLRAIKTSICNSIWEPGSYEDYMKSVEMNMDPRHCAIGIQSTTDFPADQRIRLYEWARKLFA